MVIEKRDRALLVKLFYLNVSKNSAALREYRLMKGLRRDSTSTNGLKKKVMKFENAGDFGVAPGIGRRPILMGDIDEVAVVVSDRAEHSTSVVSREMGVPWSTVRKILYCILHWYPYKIQIVQQLKPHDSQQRHEFPLQFLVRM